MRFPISVWSSYYLEYEIEDAIKAFQKADFHHTELCIEHTERLVKRGENMRGGIAAAGAEFRRFLEDNDFSVPQGHLTFQPALADPNSMDLIKKELDLYAEVGIQAAVLHANGGKELPEAQRFERRMASLNELTKHIKGSCVTICLENLGSVPETHTVERIMKFIDAADDNSQLGICLDTGHLHLCNGNGWVNQTHGEFIRGAGDRLKAMHITENGGLSDDHLMPFSSRYGLDWKSVLKAMRDVNYTGLFNFEILGEKRAPLNIRNEKMKYLRALAEIMVSDEFVMET